MRRLSLGVSMRRRVFLVAWLLEDMLAEIGCAVGGPAAASNRL
jgi:hypothetical protein